MRMPLILVSLSLLAGCAPPPPPSTGVGFGSYQDYLTEREAALAGRPAPGTALAGQITSGPITSGPIGAAPPSVPTVTVYPSTGAQQPVGAPLSATAPPATVAQPPAPAGAPAPSGRISDEQDFEAVAERETIESDRARLEANRQQYQEVAPQPLPQRTETGPNIVAYALSVNNRVGQPVWRRTGLSLANHDRACAAYASPDQAQADFLRRGGPQRDPRNLDPDGDGFACGWDPTPFQRARSGG